MKIALVGQPNSGKSTFFNAVAGYRSLTSNFAGTTVEYTQGRARLNGEVVEVVDLPGLYSLSPASPAGICTRDHLVSGEWDVLINVVDASQLARSLGLTLELLDLQFPLVLALNMMDEATRKGMGINARALSDTLGVPVVEATAVRGQGIVETFRAGIVVGRDRPRGRPIPFLYAPHLEPDVQALVRSLEAVGTRSSGERVGASNPSSPAGSTFQTVMGCAALAAPPSRTSASRAVAARGSESEDQSPFPKPNLRFRALQLLQADPGESPRLDPGTAREVERARRRTMLCLAQPPEVALPSARHAASLEVFERVVTLVKPQADWREWVDRLLMHPLWGYVFLAAVFLGFFRLVFGVGRWGEDIILGLFDQLIALLAQSVNARSVAFALVKGALLGTAGAVAVVLPYLLPFLIGLSILEDVGYLARVGYLMDAAMHRLGLHGTATVPVLLGYGCSVPALMATRILNSRRDRFVAALLAILVPCSARMTVIFALVGFYLGAYWALGIYLLNLLVVTLAGNILARIWPEIAPGMLMEVPPYRRPSPRVVLLKTWWRLREFVVVAFPLLVAGSAVLGLIEFLGWQNAINSGLWPLTWLLGLPSVVGLTLIFGVLRKELSLLMLYQALGTTHINSLMTTAQILTFTLFVTFYLPCLATLALMVRELGRKLTLAAATALLALAVVISLLARVVFQFLA